MQELTEKKVPRPTMTQFSNAESDSESEEESRRPRRHWLFGKSEDRRGKVVPESTMMKKGHLRTKTNSQAQESDIEPYSTVSDLDVRSDQIEEPTMSRDNVREEMVKVETEKVEMDSRISNRQNEQTEITLVEEPDGIISGRTASMTTKWTHVCQGTVKLYSIFTNWQHAVNATNARKMAIAYFNVFTTKKFYTTRKFKAQLMRFVPDSTVSFVCGMHPGNQNVMDDTAKKKQMVWKPNARMAQPTWNDIGEATTHDHERSRSVSLIKPQAEELMTSTANAYYPRAKKRRWNGRLRVRKIIINVSRKRKRDRTYHHRTIASIRVKSKITQRNYVHQSYLPWNPDTAKRKWKNRILRQEIGSGSQLEQSYRTTRIRDITGKRPNFEFVRTSRNDGKEGYKRVNASNPAVTKEIENEPGTTVNDGNGNSDVCTITSPCDIQPSDTPPPWITCRILEVVEIFVEDAKD
ncbi:904_t:CDS:2, partial [Acaulospora morrowiae]